jgi:very-short-patch-repair endonuclease
VAIRLEDLGPQARSQVEQMLKGSRPPLEEFLSSRGRDLKKVAPRKQDHSKNKELEETLLGQLRVLNLPKPEREYKFHPTRLWRFDMAWPGVKFAVEVDGGTWVGGGHNRGKHMESDAEKGCEAVLLGWRVIHVTTDMVEDGRAATYVERILKGVATAR